MFFFNPDGSKVWNLKFWYFFEFYQTSLKFLPSVRFADIWLGVQMANDIIDV